MHTRFGLTLMVNHACNLRCTYCYTGAKFNSAMPLQVGAAAIRRASASLAAEGLLDLGFFGGEPLLESARILEWMAIARASAQKSGQHVHFNVTTNGTIRHPDAWKVMLTEDLELAVSFDGQPDAHNRHRLDVHGKPTASLVESTLLKLIKSGKPVRVNVVVRPDTLEWVPSGIVYLRQLGIRQIDLSLDLWTSWSRADASRLEHCVERAGELWRQWLPEFSLNWFDAKAGKLAHLPGAADLRCGFGDREIAVAPSGRLYPCERLIGEDAPGQPLCLPGNALDGHDFLAQAPEPFQPHTCSACALAPVCETTCRCSNYVRTGDVNSPDGLLCRLNKATTRVTSKVLADLGSSENCPETKENCIYAE